MDYFNIIEQYPDDIFFDHFRMNRSTFEALIRALKPFWSTRNVGRCPYNLKQNLYLTLWKLSNGGVTFRQISERFNIGMATGYKMFYKTVKNICCLKKKEISWPSVSQQTHVMEEFQYSIENPFPYVVGCVDGIHFKVPKPKRDPISYYNRKGYYSMNMQGICDSKFRFLDVFIGYPGSCDDSSVWKSSPIYKAITGGQVQFAQNAIILGDAAYPISKFLLTPFWDNGNLSREQKKFNYCLSSTRVFIEQAFGILKSKFKILDHLDTASLKSVSEIVLACTILHNFIINNEHPSEYVLTDLDSQENEDSLSTTTTELTPTDEDGILLRNNLKTLISS